MPVQQPANARNGEKEILRDEYDVQQELIRKSFGNPLLSRTNLGTGHYSERFLWQQIRSYRKGLFASIAFQQTISKRAVYQTKLALGREGFSHYNESKNDVEHWDGLDEQPKTDSDGAPTSSWTDELERGEDIWESLGEAKAVMSEKQIAAIMRKTNIEPDGFLPIFWQMVSGRHDASKSKDAELLRDIFTDRRGTVGDPDEEDERMLFSRRGGSR